MSWNHRVVRKVIDNPVPGKEDERIVAYGIHEVYYGDADGVPHSCTSDPVEVSGDSVQELIQTLNRMLNATLKPVLDHDGLKEVKP